MAVIGEKIAPSYDAHRSILGEIFPISTPFNVILDVSEICNFRCAYCFRGQDDKTKWGYANDVSFMEWDLFQRAVSQIQEFPEEVRQISLSNHGEPLCNRKLPDMVRYIKKQGIKSRISIHTNAAMLNEEYAKDLADSNIDRIVVSLQGLSAEKYKEVCQANIDFDDFFHNLSVLYENKKNTQIYYKIMDVALADGEENKFYEMFSGIGDRVYVEHEVPIWKGIENSTKNAGIENKYGENFPLQQCCPLIFHTIVIAPNGDVYPCTQLLREDKLGNIQNHSLRELWESDYRTELLVRQCKLDNPEICEGCYIRQNSIYSKEDMIDGYRIEILSRLKEDRGDGYCSGK